MSQLGGSSCSEFKQKSYESNDLEYNFILGNEIEVEETTRNEQRAASPWELDPQVFEVVICLKYMRMNGLLLRNMFETS